MEQYIFAPTACEAGLEEELAAALEKRTEIFSRASLPGMWKKTDALNRYAARGQQAERNFTQGPSVGADPRGTFSGDPWGDGAKGAAHTAHCGRLLYVIGHFKPSAAAPARRKGSFRRAAAGMLQNTSGLAEASVQVVFDDEGMKVITQDSTRTVPYEEMEMLIETPQLYLLTYGGKATLLQKKDLTGDAEAFVGFLSAHALSVYQTEDQ